MDDLAGEAREARERIDALLAGKTYRQLTLAFRQVEADADGEPRTKRGRRKGCSQERTSTGAKADLAERQVAIAERVEQWVQDALALMKHADLGLLTREAATEALNASVSLSNKLRLLAKGRPL